MRLDLSSRSLRALALFLGAFLLYALTAQRGLGWGDSGEFQYRVLTLGAEGLLKGCDSFATAHPLYVVLCKLVCSTPFHVTLVSAFFGAVAVALFYLLSRNLILAALFALAHGLWWLSTVSEVYTLSLAFFAGELLALKRFRETGSVGALVALAALNGLHLEVHNLALLSIPVYAWVVGAWLCRGRGLQSASSGRHQWALASAAAFVWLLAASFWLWSFFALGPREVLFGSYGAQVLTLKPILLAAIPLNLGLGALTLAVPALVLCLGWWRRREDARHEMRDTSSRRQETKDALGPSPWPFALRPSPFALRPWPFALGPSPWPFVFLFAIHFLFWATYFIVSQYTFILPSALLAYLLASTASRGRISPKCAVLLVALQLLLPVAAWGVLSAVGFPPEYRALHPGRNDPAYFALPWHFTDDTASRAAALQRTPWKGYP